LASGFIGDQNVRLLNRLGDERRLGLPNEALWRLLVSPRCFRPN